MGSSVLNLLSTADRLVVRNCYSPGQDPSDKMAILWHSLQPPQRGGSDQKELCLANASHTLSVVHDKELLVVLPNPAEQELYAKARDLPQGFDPLEWILLVQDEDSKSKTNTATFLTLSLLYASAQYALATKGFCAAPTSLVQGDVAGASKLKPGAKYLVSQGVREPNFLDAAADAQDSADFAARLLNHCDKLGLLWWDVCPADWVQVGGGSLHTIPPWRLAWIHADCVPRQSLRAANALSWYLNTLCMQASIVQDSPLAAKQPEPAPEHPDGGKATRAVLQVLIKPLFRAARQPGGGQRAFCVRLWQTLAQRSDGGPFLEAWNGLANSSIVLRCLPASLLASGLCQRYPPVASSSPLPPAAAAGLSGWTLQQLSLAQARKSDSLIADFMNYWFSYAPYIQAPLAQARAN